MSTDARMQLRLPGAVLRLTLTGPDGAGEPLPQALAGMLLQRSGISKLDEDLFVIVPVPADEAVFDAALTWLRDLEQAWSDAGSSTGRQGLSALVFPGIALVDADSTRLLPDLLLEDFERQPPDLGSGIYLTGRATKMLEYPPELEVAPQYEGPSGKAVSILRAGEPRFDRLPWRNPEVFGRQTRYAERAKLAENLEGLLAESVTRVSGPMGCGKTRLVWDYLTRTSRKRLWLRVRPTRTATPGLGEQVIRHLLLPSQNQAEDPLHPRIEGRVDREQIRKALETPADDDSRRLADVFSERALAALDHLGASEDGTVFIVVDDFHLADQYERGFITELLRSRYLGLVFRVVLIGRSGSAWPQELEPFPVLDVPPLDSEEMDELTFQITRGLSIPEAVHARFIHSVHGYPFAYEEGLFALIHERHLRRVYGSFFFGGDETTEFQPSHRFARHVEAEVSRLGSSLPVRLLSLVGCPLPADELAAGASILGSEVDPRWEKPLLDASILRRAHSPWGAAVEIVSAVNSRALAFGFSEESAISARRELGEILSLSGSSGEAYWESYRLLAGTEEALEPLLRVFKTPYASQISRAELLEALTLELRRLREGDGDPQLELQLLWRLLPLARRAGQLNRYEEDLAHGIGLAAGDPQKLLALASIKAEIEQEAGRYAQAEATIQQALKSASGIEARRKAMLMIQLGRLYQRQNRFSEAEQLFTSLRSAFKEASSAALASTCLFHLGNIALNTGRLDEALELHTEALKERREQNLLRPIGSSLTALGAVATASGNYPQALDYYRQAQQMLEEHGKEIEVSFALLGIGRCLSRIGDFTGASGPVRRALALREGRDDAAGEAIARLAVARNYLDLGRPDTALEAARKAHFQLSMVSVETSLAKADDLLGKIHLSQRNLEDARRRLDAAIARHRDQADNAAVSFSAADLIETCLALEDADGIRRYTAELKNIIKDSRPADLAELLYFRLFRGLEWLTSKGHKVGDPKPFLERAYNTLLTKASHLDHDLRHRFLLQVPENRAIVEAATKEGLDEQERQREDDQKSAK